jgi:hypothetical protein
MVLPEGRLLEPLRHRVAKNALRLPTDESELKRLGVSFPDDALYGVHQVAEALLQCGCLRMGCLLANQDPFALLFGAPAFDDLTNLAS